MTFTDHVLDIAGSQVGVREQGGANTGPMVSRYLAAVGLHPGSPWCAAFVSWVFEQASAKLGLTNRLLASGSALHLWQHADLFDRSDIPEPGAIFVIDHGGGKGHCGIVEHVNQGAPGELICIEGNTNDSGGREGDGVYRRIRKLPIPNLVGYIVPARSLVAVPATEV